MPFCVEPVAASAALLESRRMNDRDQERLLNELSSRKPRKNHSAEHYFSWSMIVAIVLVTVCIGVMLSTARY